MASFFFQFFFLFIFLHFLGINILVLHDHFHMICNFTGQDYISRERIQPNLISMVRRYFGGDSVDPGANAKIIVSGYLEHEISASEYTCNFFFRFRSRSQGPANTPGV